MNPKPIDTTNLFSPGWNGFHFEGPAIELLSLSGEAFGRFEVAEIIARVFPAYRDFATHVMEENVLPAFTFGPYPNEVLTYKSNAVFEYKTPAQTEGLGTHSSLKKNGSSIEGVAIPKAQESETPDLLLLSVRLPPELSGPTSAIVAQVERDAPR